MSEHFHLEASLLGVHGLQFELLVLYDADFRFALILSLVEEELGEGKRGLLLVDQLISVLLNLALNGLFGEIDGCEEVIGRFLGANKSGFRRNRDLDNFGVFPTAQNNARLGLGILYSEHFLLNRGCGAGVLKFYIGTGRHYISSRCVHYIGSSAHHNRFNSLILEGAKAHFL